MGAGYGWQYEMLPCPFCEKGKIAGMWYPSAVSVRKNKTASLPGKGTVNKSKEVWIVKSGCGVCRKPMEEVEAEMKKQGII